MPAAGTIAAAEALRLVDLITPAEHGIASRVLSKSAGGSATLFAFAAGEGLTEHTSPFEALALMLEGMLVLTIGGQAVEARRGDIVRMPANVPHALEASASSRMLLIMLRG